MKFFWILTAWLCLIQFSPEVSAEYYEFIDKNGIKHFTDNLAEIPKGQRPGSRAYQSIINTEKKESEKKTEVLTSESIVNKKDELDAVYKSIVNKKELLIEQKKTIDNKKYNELVIQLNSEIQEYQKKMDVYERLVEQYNEKVNRSPKE